MSYKDFIEEMADLNMAYLLLLQRMIAENKPSACVKFGMDESLADWIESLSPTKVNLPRPKGRILKELD